MANQWWPALEDALQPPALTVRAQAIPPNDTGELMWDMFCPRQDVPSVRLSNIWTVDYRPVGDRREWNARGRRIPTPPPARRTVEIVPIETNDRIDEYEMQRIRESAGGNADVVREALGVSLSARADKLAAANYRRLELDFITAWTQGTITQKNPENGASYVASFGFSSSRLTTAGTAWNDAGVNAYTLLLAWIVAAEDLIGPIEGAMLRLATLNAILADAPNLPNSVVMTRSELADRITQDRSRAFQFFVNENSYDVPTDGGTAYTRTKAWPAQYISAVPVGKTIGFTAFAPVVRAMELSDQVPDAGIDVRGVTIFHESANGGRELAIEAQLNAVPVIDEQRLYSSNVGV